MELRDVYTREGVFTGKIIEKHGKKEKGDYLLHAILIPRARDGRYILQQRALTDRYFPGAWDLTGGGVQAGENSRQAMIREAKEELGLTVQDEEMRFLFREVSDHADGTGLIIDVFAARCDVPEDGLRFDPAEVNDVRLVGYEEFAGAILPGRSPAFAEALAVVEREM